MLSHMRCCEARLSRAHTANQPVAQAVDQPGIHTAQEVIEIGLMDVTQQLHTPPSQATTPSTLTPSTPYSTVPLLLPQAWIADRTRSKTQNKFTLLNYNS